MYGFGCWAEIAWLVWSLEMLEAALAGQRGNPEIWSWAELNLKGQRFSGFGLWGRGVSGLWGVLLDALDPKDFGIFFAGDFFDL